jgi:hypothetical protein
MVGRDLGRIEPTASLHYQAAGWFSKDQNAKNLKTWTSSNKTKEGEDIGFFVRSVEHVQGDERDIIILSMVYDGVRKNFGAITKKEKGRKRLNVAITRAKLGMIIYSSLNIDGISNDNQRDDSENFWFWKYMCYARAISSGDKPAAELVLKSLNPTFQPPKPGCEPDSYFEEDVAEFLRKQSYHVDYQIGESGFRIDLGVKRNENDRLYLLWYRMWWQTIS